MWFLRQYIYFFNIKDNLKGMVQQRYIIVARFWLYVLVLIQFGRDFDRRERLNLRGYDNLGRNPNLVYETENLMEWKREI